MTQNSGISLHNIQYGVMELYRYRLEKKDYCKTNVRYIPSLFIEIRRNRLR